MSKKTIPNPSLISVEEKQFITDKENTLLTPLTSNTNKEKKSKGRMISMTDDFYSELNNFIKENPTEGNRSSFVVRVVAEYIKKRKIHDENLLYKNNIRKWGSQ